MRRAADLSGVDVRTVHLVGGGSHNRLLCQLTADRLGLPVLAGPGDASALGNVLILESMRKMVANAFPPQQYLPRVRVPA